MSSGRVQSPVLLGQGFGASSGILGVVREMVEGPSTWDHPPGKDDHLCPSLAHSVKGFASC